MERPILRPNVQEAIERIQEFLQTREMQAEFYAGTEGEDNLGTKGVPLRISDIRLLFRVVARMSDHPQWDNHYAEARNHLANAEAEMKALGTQDRIPADLLLKAAIAHGILEMVGPDIHPGFPGGNDAEDVVEGI